MEIDVTHVMLIDQPTRYSPGSRAARQSMQAWLEQNVGPYYGEDNISLSKSVSVGAGWEFGICSEEDDSGRMYLKWIVDIADERLAAMFMLRFS